MWQRNLFQLKKESSLCVAFKYAEDHYLSTLAFNMAFNLVIILCFWERKTSLWERKYFFKKSSETLLPQASDLAVVSKVWKGHCSTHCLKGLWTMTRESILMWGIDCATHPSVPVQFFRAGAQTGMSLCGFKHVFLLASHKK